MKVNIRQITIDDTKNIVKWRNTPFVLNNFIDQRKITEESHINYYNNRILTGEVKQFIIMSDERDVGTVFLRDIDYVNKRAEYGIFIGEEKYLGKGIALNASKQILNFAFNELNLEIVFLRVLKRNTKAIKSYHNIGFIELKNKDFIEINESIEEVIFMEIKKENYLI